MMQYSANLATVIGHVPSLPDDVYQYRLRPDEELKDPSRLSFKGDGVHHAMRGIARLHNLARGG
jgi:hypothetical protein